MFLDLEEGVAELFEEAQRARRIDADHRLYVWGLKQLEIARTASREWWRRNRMKTAPRLPRQEVEEAERRARRLKYKREWWQRHYAENREEILARDAARYAAKQRG